MSRVFRTPAQIVASNHSTSEEIERAVQKVAETPMPINLLVNAAKNPQTSTKTLQLIAVMAKSSFASDLILGNVVSNRNSNEEVIETAVRIATEIDFSSAFLRSITRRRGGISYESFKNLAEIAPYVTICHPEVPEDIAWHTYKRNNIEELHYNLARSTYTPTRILDEIAESPYVSARLNLSMNPNVSNIKTLLKLIGDEEEIVAIKAMKNRSLPRSILVLLEHHSNPNVAKLATVLLGEEIPSAYYAPTQAYIGNWQWKSQIT